MSAVASVDRSTEMTPRTKGRFAGAFYLLYVVAGIYAQAFVSDRLVVMRDAATTAANIVGADHQFNIASKNANPYFAPGIAANGTPLPAAAWGGMSLLGALGGAKLLRRKR